MCWIVQVAPGGGVGERAPGEELYEPDAPRLGAVGDLQLAAVAAWILVGIGLLLIPLLHLISALVAGLLVYELVALLAPVIERHLINRGSRWLAVTALAVLTLRAAGADVVWHLPSRFEEGYGVSGETMARLAGEGVGLVVTVDCGITAVEEVAEALGTSPRSVDRAWATARAWLRQRIEKSDPT